MGSERTNMKLVKEIKNSLNYFWDQVGYEKIAIYIIVVAGGGFSFLHKLLK